MGKNSGSKARPSLKGSGSLPDYFNPPETRSSLEAGPLDEGKMAPESTETASLTKRDLLNLGADLKSYFKLSISQELSPIAQQLSELTSALKDVASTADTAMELGLSLQKSTRQLQRSEQQLSARIVVLETQARATNLKFRGLPESPDLNGNLIFPLAAWLASVLKLEECVAPTILSVYRLGPLSAVRPNFPRDVIAQFLYPRSRNVILKAERANGPLKFGDHTIQVLLDLPPEILLKRRMLKPITECLHHHKVRFRWSSTSDVLVFREGRQYRAEDISSGKSLLTSLGIHPPSDLDGDLASTPASHDEG